MREPGKRPVKAAISPARRAAFEILARVGEGKGHSDDLLHEAKMVELSAEDRRLATALVMGVLRWQIALDARLRGLLQRPDQRLAEPVAIALRMGAFQLLHMDRIPAHAALSESVELCRWAGQEHAAGMVNAVLRKLAAEKPPGKKLHELPAAFAERLGHPRWMVERWVRFYGREAALKICEAGQQEPREGGWFAESDAAMPQMDDGSRLVAELAAAAMPDARRVWDACAAPGGKTLVLALREPAADVLATDVSARRMKRMQERLRGYDYAARVRCEVADAVEISEGEFDLILCDAPCSGTGTLARNPEIRHHLRESDLLRQAERQRAIVSAAVKRLAPGGRIVYSTCSLEPEENEQVADAVLGELRRVPVEGLMQRLYARGILQGDADLSTAMRRGFLRTLPGVHPGDGFFAVVAERES